MFATHGKIYEASASAMFGIPLEQVDKDLRQRGKVAELALGYQGATGALTKMDTEKKIDPEEYPGIVDRWRQANKRIVGFWYAVENTALQVMRTGQPTGVKGLLFAREGDLQNGQDFIYNSPAQWPEAVLCKTFPQTKRMGQRIPALPRP